jgi:UPF0716 family protein affecting phage T7 exclusion
MRHWERWLCAAAALLLIAPGLTTGLIGAVLMAPVLIRQLAARRLVPA